MLFQIPIDIHWTGASGSPGVNIFHARTSGTWTDSVEIGGITEMLHTFFDTIKEIYTDAVDIDFMGEVQGVGANTGEIGAATAWHVDGGPSSPFLPPANCMLVNWRSGAGGRSGRGRTFLGPLNSFVDEANGTPAEGVRTTVQGAIDALIESSDSFGNGALGVWSRTDGVLRDFVSGDCPNKFAVLRSRRD